MTKNTKMDEFLLGILSCLGVITLFDAQTIYDEILNMMGEEDVKKLIEIAKKNDEIEFSGLQKYGYIKRS